MNGVIRPFDLYARAGLDGKWLAVYLSINWRQRSEGERVNSVAIYLPAREGEQIFEQLEWMLFV